MLVTIGERWRTRAAARSRCKNVDNPPALPPVRTNCVALWSPRLANRKSKVASKLVMPRKVRERPGCDGSGQGEDL
jgi:hypothetical protein